MEHENVVTLESSKPLQKVLRSKGFTVGDTIPQQTKVRIGKMEATLVQILF